MESTGSPTAVGVTAALARLDAALARTTAPKRALAPGAKGTQLTWLGQRLGLRVPEGLGALLAWHNGERNDGGVFHVLIGPDVADPWNAWNDASPFEVRLLGTAAIADAGAYDVVVSDDGVLHRAYAGGPTPNARLAPFLWIRACEPFGSRGEGFDAEEADESGEHRRPSDDDWLIAVDTLQGGVHLFEIGNQGLEGVATLASSMPVFFDGLAERVETGHVRFPEAREETKQEVDAARRLLEVLVTSRLVEVEEGREDRLVDALRSRLVRKPRRRAIESTLELLTSSDDVAEVYAPDDALAVVVDEFVG